MRKLKKFIIGIRFVWPATMDPTHPKSITNGVNTETVERSSEKFDLDAENKLTWNPVWDQ